VRVPVGGVELVGDEQVRGVGIRDAQQRVDTARLALPAADRLDEGDDLLV
jgi:hypothetical protein